MNVTKLVCDSFINYIKKNNICGEDIVIDLMNKVKDKVITPREFAFIIDKLGLNKKKFTVEAMSKCMQQTEVILKPKYENITKMNYRELESYSSYLKSNEIDETTIFDRLFEDFQKGKMYARDLQYILEGFGYEIDEEFINDAIKHGVYCEDISKLTVLEK
ncbi:MAG TPA: hypothetical protein DDW20_05510 [Firmicutes bacterium]|nr:hypothetical protein [Bacillota bacterium]